LGATHLVDSVVACAAEGLAVEDLVAGQLQSTPYGLVAPERIRFSRAAGDFDTSALQSLLVCEMHRGERDAIFTSPLSSEPKCLSFIALLLEARFYHAQDRRRCKSTVRRVMHHPVGVSLRRAMGFWLLAAARAPCMPALETTVQQLDPAAKQLI